MSRVLITGATGYIGQHLSQYLAQAGLDVHGLGRGPKPNGWAWFWHQAHLSDLSTLKKTLHQVKPDYLFHLAGLVRGASLADLLEVNVIGTEHLLNAVLDSCPHAQVLVTGSGAEYGLVQKEDLPISETCSLQPLSPYGLSKVSQSLLAAQYGRRHSMAIMRVRTFNLTGPGEPPTQVASAIARQIALIEAGNALPEIQVGNLDTIRDFIDVRDSVRAYWCVMNNGQPGEVYNVCSGQGVQIRTLLDTLLTLTPKAVEIRQTSDRLTPWDVPIHVGDPARLKRLANFEPAFSLQESLSALLDEWRGRITNESKID